MQKTYSAQKIFTGDSWLTNATVIVEQGIVKEIINNTVLKNAETAEILIPAFIDLQIYGANKKLLAVHPTVEALEDLYNYSLAGGAALCMPTLATNTREVFHKGIDAVRQYWENGRKGILGIHLEGPWINATKRGAHVENLIHAPAIEEVKDLLEYGKDVIKIITLAPEICTDEIIQLIRAYGIIISAGHSNAEFSEAIHAFNKGITTVTHLYNAMSGLQHRQPGLVGATFDHSSVMASIIPDGYHADYAAIRIAKKVMKERLFVITDAVTETEEGPYQHLLIENKYECNGVLSGSALTMHKAFLNLVNHVGVEMEEAIRMCGLYPAVVIGCDDKYGKIAPGYAAQFLVLNKQLKLMDVITW